MSLFVQMIIITEGKYILQQDNNKLPIINDNNNELL